MSKSVPLRLTGIIVSFSVFFTHYSMLKYQRRKKGKSICILGNISDQNLSLVFVIDTKKVLPEFQWCSFGKPPAGLMIHCTILWYIAYDTRALPSSMLCCWSLNVPRNCSVWFYWLTLNPSHQSHLWSCQDLCSNKLFSFITWKSSVERSVWPLKEIKDWS